MLELGGPYILLIGDRVPPPMPLGNLSKACIICRRPIYLDSGHPGSCEEMLVCDWLGLEHRRPICVCLSSVDYCALLILAPGLAASCQRRARDLQRISQPVLTRLVPQPQGIGAVVCSICKAAAEPGVNQAVCLLRMNEYFLQSQKRTVRCWQLQFSTPATHECLLRAVPLRFQAAPSTQEAAGEPGEHTSGKPGPQARLGWHVDAQLAHFA